jgi:hypothetical protein
MLFSTRKGGGYFYKTHGDCRAIFMLLSLFIQFELATVSTRLKHPHHIVNHPNQPLYTGDY